MGNTDQRVPSQDSIKGLLLPRTPLMAEEKPVVVHTVAETQDTPSRRLLPVPALGLGTTDQRLPSQDSIKVLKSPLLSVE